MYTRPNLVESHEKYTEISCVFAGDIFHSKIESNNLREI